MDNQISSKNIMINYGVYLAVASILVNLIFYATGTLISLGWLIGIIGLFLMIGIITLGIKKYKEVNSGLLSWGQAVKIGIGISIIAGLIGVIYGFIFNNYIDPTMQEQIAEIQRQAWADANMTSEQIEAAEEMAKSFSSPAISSAIQIVASAFFGFVISAIAGAIMKKTEGDEY